MTLKYPYAIDGKPPAREEVEPFAPLTEVNRFVTISEFGEMRDALALLLGQHDELAKAFMAFRTSVKDELAGMLENVAEAEARLLRSGDSWSEKLRKSEDHSASQLQFVRDQLKALEAKVSKADPLAAYRQMLNG